MEFQQKCEYMQSWSLKTHGIEDLEMEVDILKTIIES